MDLTPREPSELSPSGTSATAGADPTRVTEALKGVDRLYRASQLYARNNPGYWTALERSRASFERLWEVSEAFRIQVGDGAFRWAGEDQEVEIRLDGALAQTLYGEGVRGLVISAGFEEVELPRFVDVLARGRRVDEDDDDLLTRIWSEAFLHLSLRHVRVQEGIPPLRTGNTPGRQWEAGGGAPDTSEEAVQELVTGADHPPGAGPLDSLDLSRHFLEPDEVAALRREADAEYALDAPHRVALALLDILDAGPDEARAEVPEALQALVLSLLGSGQLPSLVSVLSSVETAVAARRGDPGFPVHLLEGSLAMVTEADAVRRLLESLGEGDLSLGNLEGLRTLSLAWGEAVLAPLLECLARRPKPVLRRFLQEQFERLSREHPSALHALLSHSDPQVVRLILRRIQAEPSPEALPALKRLLNQRDALGSAVMEAVGAIGGQRGEAILAEYLGDPDPHLRQSALRWLKGSSNLALLPKIEPALELEGLRALPQGEQMALLELYAGVAGEASLSLLSRILSRKPGFLSRGEDPELRAAAAKGLSIIGTAAAREVLRAFASDGDVVVRAAVERALKAPSSSRRVNP
jgi:HEAT repeat protein